MPRDAWAVTDYSVKIPAGWAMQHGHLFNKHADTPAEFGFYAVTVDEIFSNPCVLYSPPRTVGPGVDVLVKALSKQPGPVVSDPVETTLGGHRAVRLDLATPKRWQNCPMLEDGVGLQIWLSEPADKHLLMTLDGITSVYILDLRSGRQVFVTAVGGETTDAQRPNCDECSTRFGSRDELLGQRVESAFDQPCRDTCSGFLAHRCAERRRAAGRSRSLSVRACGGCPSHTPATFFNLLLHTSTRGRSILR